MKGYEKKNIKPASVTTKDRATGHSDKAQIVELTREIAEKLLRDPKGTAKAGKILSDWLNAPAEKKPLKKAG